MEANQNQNQEKEEKKEEPIESQPKESETTKENEKEDEKKEEEVPYYYPKIWKDIERVPQFSDEVKLLKIDYTPDENELMDIFRGVVKSGEVSRRVYRLTDQVIDNFPTNYVAWVVRRKCLDKMSKQDLYMELNWLNGIIVENQKNYQIWHHRKLLIDKLNDCSQEKRVLNFVFADEQKNFHAWSHRIWMIRRFNNTDGEFDFIDNMLKKDIKNNSVWNYRFFLVLYMNENKINKDIAEKEIKYALDKMKIYPLNECPFSYIRGFVKKFGFLWGEFPEDIKEISCLEGIDKNPFALNVLLDYYEEEKNEKKYEDTINILMDLDFIRKKYYLWRRENRKF